MEEQTTWKGHTFTLMVFTGIVVLASIFFVLGMLVGRAQAQKLAGNVPATESVKADAKLDAKPDPKEDKPNFTFYDSVKKEPPAVLEPAPKIERPSAPDPPPATKAAPPVEKPAPITSKPENVLNYQVGALRKSADAERLLSALKAKGFRAFILSPSASDSDPYYRVQVGPFTDPIEAQEAKRKLESAKYQPILKK
jgi:cell division septation protein DedD